MGGPQYRPQDVIILLIGTLKKVPPIFGNCHVSHSRFKDSGFRVKGVRG